MDQKRKEYIDSLWVDSLLGKWHFAIARGRFEEAEKIAEEVLESYPFTLYNLEELLCEEIAAKLEYPGEFEEYLKILDREDPNLVEVVIQNDTFGKLY